MSRLISRILIKDEELFNDYDNMYFFLLFTESKGQLFAKNFSQMLSEPTNKINRKHNGSQNNPSEFDKSQEYSQPCTDNEMHSKVREKIIQLINDKRLIEIDNYNIPIVNNCDYIIDKIKNLSSIKDNLLHDYLRTVYTTRGSEEFLSTLQNLIIDKKQIVIVDPYFGPKFKMQNNQNNLALELKHQTDYSIEFLKKLINGSNIEEITIYTSLNVIEKFDNTNIEEIKTIIIEDLQYYLNNCFSFESLSSVNVTIVYTYYKKGNIDQTSAYIERMHNRYLIADSFVVTTGNSFVYNKSNNCHDVICLIDYKIGRNIITEYKKFDSSLNFNTISFNTLEIFNKPPKSSEFTKLINS